MNIRDELIADLISALAGELGQSAWGACDTQIMVGDRLDLLVRRLVNNVVRGYFLDTSDREGREKPEGWPDGMTPERIFAEAETLVQSDEVHSTNIGRLAKDFWLSSQYTRQKGVSLEGLMAFAHAYHRYVTGEKDKEDTQSLPDSPTEVPASEVVQEFHAVIDSGASDHTKMGLTARSYWMYCQGTIMGQVSVEGLLAFARVYHRHVK